MRTLLGLVGVLWAQSRLADPYIPELPPFELRELSGHWEVQVKGGGVYRDSSGDFTAWTARLSWEEGQEWYPASPITLSAPLYQQKQPRQYLRLYAWQLHRSGRLLRLWSERPSYTLQPQTKPSLQLRQTGFAGQSVLASGRWYKVATGAAGVYRITAQTLQRLGLNPSGVDPRHLRVYGQRGGPLPQPNNHPQPDDLVELPLYFPGEVDGRWDPEDVAYFWADSPDAWYPLADPTRPYFHLKNPYTDRAYYFLTFDLGPGRRLTLQAPPTGTFVPRTQGLLLYFYENDAVNLLKSGRVWFGEKMTPASPTVSITLSIPACDSARVRVQMAASSFTPNQITLTWAGTLTASVNIPAIPGPADNLQARWGLWSPLLLNTPANPTLTLSYTGSGTGYLDYVEVIGWHPLVWTGGQQVFYLPAGGPWQTELQTPGSPFLWDVTDPLNYEAVALTPTPNGVRFLSAGDTLRRYCAFDLASAYEVTPIGYVPNQNLHSLRGIRFVVATTPALEGAAQRFCDLHPEAGPCVVVTTEKLYNEFSGGRPDICALRNFLRMLYVRASTPAEAPQMLLIVGAANYDFRKTSDFLFPTYQSRESLFPPASFGSDDFFGFLDDLEGFWGEGTAFPRDPRWYDPRDQTQQDHLLDIGIARLPVYSAADLEAYLEKLTDYLQNPAAKGPWLQKIILFSDYKDNGLHTQQAEALANQIQGAMPYLDLVKLYIDRYPAQPRASGLVFPEAQKALLAQLDQGAFIAHYVGHGNEYALQGFEFFPNATVRQLQNVGRYLFFVTATCEWGKWDEAPEVRSGGIEALFLPRRGAIGLLTSTRKVYASLNFQLTQLFYQELSQTWQTARRVLLGQVMQATKNRTIGGALGINSRSYAFLGDPFLPLGLPAYDVVVTEIDGDPPSATAPDTLRPLRAVRMRGEIRDAGGGLQSDFSGEVALNVWDKPLTRQTLISRTLFTAQDILLFSGRATVQNGRFELTFYLPVDLIPEPGRGRVSLWAQASTGQAAAGSETRLVICCPDTLPPSLPPPTIRLFLNDTTWGNGGWTDPNPLLLAFLYDSLGINLSPLAVGRELKATLNGQDYFLSPYYRARRDQPNQGTLEYRFSNLPEGQYHLRLRAFNLAGQEGSAETSFLVVEKGQLKLGRVFNYPNPFTTATRFCFEHNQPGQPLEARVFIYTVSGRLVQTLSAPIPTQNTFSQDLFWDGLDSYGDKLGRGVYLYRLEVRNLATGETAHAQEKLVILR
mgnify:CR=1 FL=1